MPVRDLIIEVDGDLRELDCSYPDELIAIDYDGPGHPW